MTNLLSIIITILKVISMMIFYCLTFTLIVHSNYVLNLLSTENDVLLPLCYMNMLLLGTERFKVSSSSL